MEYTFRALKKYLSDKDIDIVKSYFSKGKFTRKELENLIMELPVLPPEAKNYIYDLWMRSR